MVTVDSGSSSCLRVHSCSAFENTEHSQFTAGNTTALVNGTQNRAAI